MISNNETITEYLQYNKIYIPTTYYNQNYKYTISGNEVTIITNQNCYTNYNTQYCDCYRYNEQYNIITQPYSCNSSPGNYQLSYASLTDNINYSYRITNDYVNNYTIMFGTLIIGLLITGLFKKNSRSI